MFSNALFKLRVYSISTADVGVYNLIVKCTLPDGLSSSSDFVLNVTYDGRIMPDPNSNSTNNTNDGNSSSKENTSDTNIIYEPNFPPKFLRPLMSKWVVRAGSEGNFTMPETYDPNANDKVKISITFVEDRFNQFFKI